MYITLRPLDIVYFVHFNSEAILKYVTVTDMTQL